LLIEELNAGTAGIWRIGAINEAGGWKDRTTVEDMDLAVRASLRGWKFLYLGDLQVNQCSKLTINILHNGEYGSCVMNYGLYFVRLIICTLLIIALYIGQK